MINKYLIPQVILIIIAVMNFNYLLVGIIIILSWYLGAKYIEYKTNNLRDNKK